MRDTILAALFLSSVWTAAAQTVPAGWKVLKDSKGACEIAVPPDWTPFSESSGAAVFHDSTTAIAVVTSQPGQVFKPLTDAQLRTLGVPKDKILENSAKRLLYQDRSSRNAEDPNALSSMVPSKDGACSCHVVYVPSIGEETAKKIALSLGPATEEKAPSQP